MNLNLITAITSRLQHNGVTVPTVSSVDVLSGKTLDHPTVTGYVESPVALGVVTTAATLSLSGGTVLSATLTAATTCAFTMPTPVNGQSFLLMLSQAVVSGTGIATFTGVKWPATGAPIISPGAGKMDVLSFLSDGTSWYGAYVQGYTP